MPYYPERSPSASEQEQGLKQAAKKRKLLRLSVVILSCALIGYGGIRLLRYQSDLASSRETSAELKRIYTQEEDSQPDIAPPADVREDPRPGMALPAAAQEASEGLPPREEALEEPETAETDADLLLPVPYPDNPQPMITDRFLKLRRQSPYIVGWLSMDGVEEAVAQKDNFFFLDHDASGKKNSNGAIFLDEGISLNTRPYTIILYGHNMKSGNMFGRLKKYLENAYFYQHQIIAYNSMYEEGQYAVFAAMEMSTTPGVASFYHVWSLTAESRSRREEAIRTLERRSMVSCALDVQADDQILLLITCLDGDTERLVVAARRLREGEKPASLSVRQ